MLLKDYKPAKEKQASNQPKSDYLPVDFKMLTTGKRK